MQDEAGIEEFDLVGIEPTDMVEAGGLEIRTRDPVDLKDDLGAWCRLTQNEFVATTDAGDHTKTFVRKGTGAARWEEPDWGVRLPQKKGGRIDLRDWLVGRAGEIPGEAPTYYGFVPRGAVPEPGMPEYPYTLHRRLDVWADNVQDLYEQAKSKQWNATTDIPWSELRPLPDAVERAVCQLMTFLAENEYAALYMPAKFPLSDGARPAPGPQNLVCNLTRRRGKTG